jgi:hypothetical protein
VQDIDRVFEPHRVGGAKRIGIEVADHFKDSGAESFPGFGIGMLAAILSAVPIWQITASGIAIRSRLLPPTQWSGFSSGAALSLVQCIPFPGYYSDRGIWRKSFNAANYEKLARGPRDFADIQARNERKCRDLIGHLAEREGLTRAFGDFVEPSMGF